MTAELLRFPATPQPWENDRKAYRLDHEAPDGRPRVLWKPFWASPDEEARYVAAFRRTPRLEVEGWLSFARRIAEAAAEGPLEDVRRGMAQLPPRDRE